MTDPDQDRLLLELRAQIEDLQARVVFQDDALLQLDEVVIGQAARLDSLQRQVAELLEKLDRLRDERNLEPRPGDEKPPHY
ncbi:MAG: SlyX [Pseudomonadota bacterium]|jgi:uncharacterized coiled-coil protein SlyX